MDPASLIAALSLTIWIYLLCARGGFWRIEPENTLVLPAPASWPGMTVIVPARNEADILNATLPSLLNSDYLGSLNIILVDDSSEDATASVAKAIAEKLKRSERLTVISGQAFASDWKGKVRAMQTGLDHITTLSTALPRYVLFTDADIAYDKGAITKLVAHTESGHYVLASLMVRLRCQSFAERLLIPAFVYFFRMLYPFRWVSDSQYPLAAAAGGCMLVRYDALLSAGGLRPIRNALIDDCAMARLLKPQGRISLKMTKHVHSMRPYPRIDDIRQMVARSAYNQLGYSPLNLMGVLLGIAIVFMAPVMVACLSSGLARYCGLTALACMAWSFLPMLRFYKRSLSLSILLPVIAAFYAVFTLDSAFQHKRGRGGMWKGRIQSVSIQST